jgi:hypothetical protein
MASYTSTSGLGVSRVVPHSGSGIAGARRRRIAPEAGHALEVLGHAIEYLADEFVHEGSQFSPDDGRIQAVQLLMRINRQIYLDCLEVPTLGERLRSLLGLRAA